MTNPCHCPTPSIVAPVLRSGLGGSIPAIIPSSVVIAIVYIICITLLIICPSLPTPSHPIWYTIIWLNSSTPL